MELVILDLSEYHLAILCTARMDGNKEWKEPLLPDNDGGRFWWLARLQNDLLVSIACLISSGFAEFYIFQQTAFQYNSWSIIPIQDPNS